MLMESEKLKVVVLSYSPAMGISLRSSLMLDMLSKLNCEIEHISVDDVRSKIPYGQVFTFYDEFSHFVNPQPVIKSKAKGPRGRWGKLK